MQPRTQKWGPNGSRVAWIHLVPEPPDLDPPSATLSVPKTLMQFLAVTLNDVVRNCYWREHSQKFDAGALLDWLSEETLKH